jgi:hypothetical protein
MSSWMLTRYEKSSSSAAAHAVRWWQLAAAPVRAPVAKPAVPPAIPTCDRRYRTGDYRTRLGASRFLPSVLAHWASMQSTCNAYWCCAASCSRTAVSSCFLFLAASFAALAFSLAAFSSCFCCRFCAFISDLVIGAVVASLVRVVEDVPVEGVVLVVVVVEVCAFVRRGCSTIRPAKQLTAANLE